jgi:hypothetical protein
MLYRFARIRTVELFYSRCNVSLSMRSSLATCLHWLAVILLEAVESVEDVSFFRVVEERGWQFVLSGPSSEFWLAMARIFLCNFFVLALDRKCRQRRRRQMDAPKIF